MSRVVNWIRRGRIDGRRNRQVGNGWTGTMDVARHGLGGFSLYPKLKVSHPKQSSPILYYHKVYRMSYRADVAKHIHAQQWEADGERELPVVLCMLNSYCLRLRPAGPCWFRCLLGTRGTELARNLLIFLCESAQKCIISHKIPQNFLRRVHSPLPRPHAH